MGEIVITFYLVIIGLFRLFEEKGPLLVSYDLQELKKEMQIFFVAHEPWTLVLLIYDFVFMLQTLSKKK